MSDPLDKFELAAWVGFVTVQGRLFQRIEEDLRCKSSITHPEYEVLLRLSFASGHRARIQDLAAASLLTRSGTSRVVDRLVRAGLVERADAEEDGRGAYAVITGQGRSHFKAAAKHHMELVQREFIGRFTHAELEQLASFWRRFDGISPAPAKTQRKKRG